MKRRGNRRYYQHHEVLMVRRIRELLYEQGFTISGARNRCVRTLAGGDIGRVDAMAAAPAGPTCKPNCCCNQLLRRRGPGSLMEQVKEELLQIRSLLSL
jgi:DNA-binding transcriptional MerR regulator